jgi:hypothetical protein
VFDHRHLICHTVRQSTAAAHKTVHLGTKQLITAASGHIKRIRHKALAQAQTSAAQEKQQNDEDGKE